jgi:hypothetical protein
MRVNGVNGLLQFCKSSQTVSWSQNESKNGDEMKHNFRSIKNATFDAVRPPNAAPERVGLIAAGNPDVIREARGQEDYARKRKRGGRVKFSAIDGVRPRHRLDRPTRGRRKFADGGTTDERSDQSPLTTASPDDAPSSTSRGFVDASMANPKVRAGRVGGHRQS